MLAFLLVALNILGIHQAGTLKGHCKYYTQNASLFPSQRSGIDNALQLGQDISIIRTLGAISPPFLVATTYPSEHVLSWIQADVAHNETMQRWFSLKTHEIAEAEYSRMICIDAGGNHGFYSIFMALVGCPLTHYFEIQPSLRSMFAISVAANGVHDKVLVHPMGVSDTTKSVQVVGSDGSTFLASLQGGENDRLPPEPTDTSTTVGRIDDRVGKETFVILAKIDVEGHEIQALLGMSKLLHQSRVGALLVEIGPARWDRTNLSVVDGIATLHDIFYPKGMYTAFVLAHGDLSCPDMRPGTGIAFRDAARQRAVVGLL